MNPAQLAKNLNSDLKVVVAMSGGVDSSVAALLLKRQGYELLGVSMQVWDYRQHGGAKSRATCCAPSDFCDARMVAHSLEVPYYVFDFEQHFRSNVIDKFVKSYKDGLTPNPCIECNNKVKFRELRQRAKVLGGNYVATGHYARILPGPGGLRLLRGVDKDKDQSYFLYGLKQEELSQTLFPIGDLCKSEVRELAREAGLATASKPESQDICFVQGELSDFLVQVGVERKKGLIRRRSGEVLGEHQGIHNFTVGQRRGLNVGGSEKPLYVLQIIGGSNEVLVGEKQELETPGFDFYDCSWVSPEILAKIAASKYPLEFEAIAQVRHRHPGVKVRVKLNNQNSGQAEFQAESAVASPGQAAVFYSLDNLEVLGGGVIGTLP